MDADQNRSSGRLRIGLILFWGLIGTGIYLGFQLAPYWITAYEMQDLLSDQARKGLVSTEEEIRGTILRKAQALGIALTEEDISIRKDSEGISISTQWQFDYNFFGLYTHTFSFDPAVTFQYR